MAAGSSTPAMRVLCRRSWWCQALDNDAIPPPAFSGPGRTGAERIGKALAILRERSQTSSLAELFDSIVQQTGYRESFNEGTEEDLQRWANVLELRADLERFDQVDPSEALAAYLEQVSLIADVDSMKDDERGQVTLITLHSAKGLEFPVVFITGVEEGLLPISRSIEAEPFDKTPMEEERRPLLRGHHARQETALSDLRGEPHDLRSLSGRSRLALSPEHSRRIGTQRHPLVGARSGSVGSNSRYASTSTSYSSSSSSSSSSRMPTGNISTSWTSASDPKPDATPKIVLPDYKPGQRVFHPKFGEGTIQRPFPAGMMSSWR